MIVAALVAVQVQAAIAAPGVPDRPAMMRNHRYAPRCSSIAMA